ncbi:hypothetical protein C8Q74DRAFT_43542 [Fomes fomentarius]|nr:hypothetical protein C8Q74DRAFT_43542 [Fomes fomentarius]
MTDETLPPYAALGPRSRVSSSTMHCTNSHPKIPTILLLRPLATPLNVLSNSSLNHRFDCIINPGPDPSRITKSAHGICFLMI